MKDKPCILVVDDDPNISRLEQLYLEKEGYEVRVAADGNDAIEAFRKLPPDMVLLDRDIFTVAPEEIKDIRPLITMTGGKLTFSALSMT